MINHSKRIIAGGLILGLGACSYGGGGGGGDVANADDVAAINPLNFGTTDANASSNGLAFASAASTLTDVNDETITVRMVRHITDPATGEVVLEITNETIDIDDITEEDENLTATIGGETIVFIDGEGERANGASISVDEFGIGEFSTVRSLFSYPDEGEQTEAFFAVGIETSPEVIQALTGQVTYMGGLSGFGTQSTNGGEPFLGEASFSGTVALTADFATQQIAGSSDISLDESEISFAFDIPETAITGNGFGTEMTLVSCSDGLTCTSNSQIGGVFFGLNGEELTGLTGLDLSATDADGLTTTYVGAGGFVAASAGI